MTREMYERLNSLSFPEPTGRFIMDGTLDTAVSLVASNGPLRLHASVRDGQLYVATNSAQSEDADVLVFVAVAQESLRVAPWGKSGHAAGWMTFLGNKNADNSTGWSDAMASSLEGIVADTVATILEGVVDIELLTGVSPNVVYIAMGKYDATNGRLLNQVPRGNGDENIDPNEFYVLHLDDAESIRH
jgi:hypothetical protein